MSDIKPIPLPPPEAGSPIKTVVPPPAPPVPRLIDNAGPRTPMRPTRGAVVNVGDLMARLGDGTACPAGHWPRTGDPAADRRAFAAAFRGASASHCDPTRTRHGPEPVVLRIEIQTGGNWWFPVQGDVAKDDPLGPAITDGALAPAVLEACPKDEAVAVAVAEEAGGWRVKLLGPR